MAGNGTQPFRGKQRLDSKRLPKRPKAKGRTNADDSPGSRGSKKWPGGLWGVVGLVGSFAALWLYSATQQTKQRRRKADVDGLLLARLRSQPLSITEHGACRMGCRHISEPEVLEVLRSGSINSQKSSPRLQPCPKYVVDGHVGASRKNVQCVFSACQDATHLVTVIDRDTDWKNCFCP